MKDDVQLEDYVRAIADLMKPWRFRESYVFVAIQEELEDMRRNFPKTPEMGIRSENKRRAERVIDVMRSESSTAPRLRRALSQASCIRQRNIDLQSWR